MSTRRSKKEIALLGGVGIYILATLGMLIWSALTLKSVLGLLGAFYSPLLWIGSVSFMLLLRRREAGGWCCLAFFLLQGVTIEKGGVLVWPPVASVGINFELLKNSTYVLDIGISSIILAIISAAVIFQLSEEKALAATPEASRPLPPNTSLERTREG